MMAATHPRWSVSYIAFVLHRLSGLALALFLPFHFLVLGLWPSKAKQRLMACWYGQNNRWLNSPNGGWWFYSRFI